MSAQCINVNAFILTLYAPKKVVMKHGCLTTDTGLCCQGVSPLYLRKLYAYTANMVLQMYLTLVAKTLHYSNTMDYEDVGCRYYDAMRCYR